MKQIAEYMNGTYMVHTFEDGTQIKHTKSGEYIADFPDGIDLKITDCCDMNCPWCHEDSKPDGKHGELLDDPIIQSLHRGTEVAIGGGNPLTHPQLTDFLSMLKDKGVIANMTVNQTHFMKDPSLFDILTRNKLIYGLGVSLVKPTDDFISAVSKLPNVVIHVVCGATDPQIITRLANKGSNLKVLFLGYKRKRRGNTYYTHSHDSGIKIDCNIQWVSQNLKSIAQQFKVIGFDNLAIEQLGVKSILPDSTYRMMYRGNDGQFTMFVDAVKREYAVSSTSEKRFSYSGKDTIDSIFKDVKRGNIVHDLCG